MAIIAGHVANSIALIGFAADSMIDSLSGGILLWRLQAHTDEKRTNRMRLVGASFLVLALYVSGETI